MGQKVTIQELQAYRQNIKNAESPKAQFQAIIDMYRDMHYAGWIKIESMQ